MTDRRSRETSLPELEFNDLNIHLYLTLNYGTASEHLDFDFMVLYNALLLRGALTITQNSICTIIGFGSVSSLRYPIRRKWPDRSQYRSWVSDRCIPTLVYNIFCHILGWPHYHIPSIMLGTLRPGWSSNRFLQWLWVSDWFVAGCQQLSWGSTGCSSRVCLFDLTGVKAVIQP